MDQPATGNPLLSAEEYEQQRPDLPDGGRWTELAAGRLVRLSPPDPLHGTAVLNLGKAFARFAPSRPDGYACFELGLIVGRGPDTVWHPAASYFVGGEPFAEVDRVITATRPVLVVEVTSSSDRRCGMTERIGRWHAWGVPVVWTLDPHTREARVCVLAQPPRTLTERETLTGTGPLVELRIVVGELFAEPEWWSTGRPNGSPR